MEHPVYSHAAVGLVSLPAELLGEIFYQCSASSSDAPLVLRHVDRLFRQIVDSTPRVWSYLRLELGKESEVRAIEKAGLWFSKSGGCLVDVEVQAPPASSSLALSSLSAASQACVVGRRATTVFSILGENVGRIRSMDVVAASEADARALLHAVYPANSTCSLSSTPAALDSLSIRVSSKTPPPCLSPLSPSFTSTGSNNNNNALVLSSHLLSCLERLTLTNHTTSFLTGAGGDLGRLRHLSISCPIRFAPLGVDAVLGVLRGAPMLETLVLESRMVEGGGEGTMNAVNAAATTIDNGAGASTTSTGTDTTTPFFTTIPFLTSLSLRTNAVPSLLSHLLLPNLRRLRVEDLNGRRVGGGEEMAVVLRGLLVRMELPSVYHAQSRDRYRDIGGEREGQGGGGLEAVELVGVDVSLSRAARPRMSAREGVVTETEESAWAWCFRRMTWLKELSLSETDPGSVLEFLAAASPSPSPHMSLPAPAGLTSQMPAGPNADIDTICPRLHALTLKSAHHIPPPLLQRLRASRPNLHVAVDVMQDPFFQSVGTAPVDFLSLYANMPGRSSSSGGVESGKRPGSVRSWPKRFGPWVVLGQGSSESKSLEST